jgi:S-layer homology domain
MGRKSRNAFSCLAGGVLLVVGSLAAEAQEAALAGRATDGEAVVALMAPETYGTASLTRHTIPAFGFASLDDSVLTEVGPYNRFSPTGQEAEAPLFLPNGALIEAIELEGCDTDAAGQILFALFRATSSGGFVVLSPVATTGFAPTPGCGFYLEPLTTFHQVDNGNTYYVAVRSSTTSATSYTSVRVHYRLQVSPAPAVATFPVDVPPSHPFFRFIEALAAAGITAGTGPGEFSPNNPVTRGQMAVFLSIALGLHFPN